MRPRRVLLAATAGLASLTLALTGCSGGSGSASSSQSSGTPQSGGDLVMDRDDDPQSLMPTVPTDNLSIWALENIYDTLLVPSKDGHSVEPSLATSYEQSPDKLSWTFHLRQGVEFSNGQPLTSKDVKFSLEQSSDPESPFGFINEIIQSIATPDDSTVVITTKQPWSPLPSDVALYANSIVPADYAGMSRADFEKKPIGTGPFRFGSWTKGQELKLVKNPHYWKKGLPYLNSVTFRVVPDANTRALQVQGGQAQINEFPAYSSIQGLKNSSTVKVGLFPSSRVDYLSMNNRQAPFDDAHIRRAVSYAIDRASLIKAVLYGNGQPATAFLTPALWGHNSEMKGIAYDMAQAKSELAASTKPEGFATTLTISSGDPDQAAMAQIIQKSLSQIGITATIKQLDPSALTAAKHAGNFDMTFGYCTTDIIDPDEIVRFVADYDGGSNAMYSGYKNPAITAQIQQAAQLPDEKARKAIYDQIQVDFDKDQPVAPLYYSPSAYSFSSKVHGFTTLPTGNYTLADTWLSK